ncbi:Non-specific protein-tyrosine kinase [Parvibaculum lavamentivorans DS-1]|uniref:non-specific protein-tyrosine kinase n=1 Tax=Parvibaculum lavamentivorans (strain DS-1 / DSM 13023 / NCIMB 13966) TaxID=402881 RepID=A7HUD8_PARL1|nr:polysaccharide biosynthesis tyrosine autokinase [Parvibaculum lavamentivorans]ABS63521.1 Non-specific protein-tyrosine kinase [Parvibaculum lavamentivorans DS-1]
MNAPVKGASARSAGGSPDGPSGALDDGILSLDISGVVRGLRKRLGMIAGITVVLTALVALAVSQMTPLYTGETVILLSNQQMQVVDIESVMSGRTSEAAAIDSEVQVLQSRNLIRRVVEDLNLVEDPELNWRLAEPSPWRWANPGYWMRLAMRAISPSAPEAEDAPEAEERPEEAVISAVLSRMTVLRRGATYVIELTFESESPEKAARIANAIADAYVVDQLEAKFDATKQANEWLSRRLDDLRVQVSEAERAVEIYRTQHGLEQASGLTVGEQQLSELNAQLILARAALVEARAKYSRARQIRSQGGSIESVADVLQSTTISGLRQKQAELAREKANLSAKYGPRHPAIINIEAQQADIGSQIGAEVGRIIESIANNVSVAETRVTALEESLRQIKGDAGTDNQALIQLRELEREAASSRTVYEAFLNRFKETSEQQGLQTPDTRIISAAIASSRPSYPNTKRFVGIGFVLALFIAIGIALLVEHFDNAIQSGSDIEQALDLPHLVSLPVVPSEKGADGKIMPPHDYLLAKPLSAFSESLRSLRSALQLSNVDNPPKLILFTSALPSEGKTTTSASFARAAAASGLKVVLIDCDLRHPSVHRTFGLARPQEGLVELLAERLEVSAVVVKDPKSDLDIIPIAAGTANPPDVLGSSQMKLLLQRLADSYDLVVLDSAPILPVSDSRVLSRLVDETVFVVRWATTPRDAAQTAVKELRRYEANIAGVVLAIVDTAKQARYGYGDGGYYGRYSKYYVN